MFYIRQVASECGQSWVDVIRRIDWQHPACSKQCGLSNHYGGGDYQKQEGKAIMNAMFWVSMFVLLIAIVMSRDY